MTLFDLSGRTAVVIGASGAIGGAVAQGLARAGARVALCYNSRADAAKALAEKIAVEGGTTAIYQVDAMLPESLEQNAGEVAADLGEPHILVNCGGGNLAAAMVSSERSLFDADLAAIEETMQLNFSRGTVAPCIAYGRRMVATGAGGSIINVTSMNVFRPLEGRPAYAASKAAVANFTQWLACYLAREHDAALRVNAIAPGFFPNARMRAAIYDESGALNARGRRIVELTPMGRLGEVADLVGTAIWLAAPASRFVTGTVIPVDGGFNAYAGL